MTSSITARQILISLLGGALLATPLHAQTPAAAQQDGTRVDDVTVIGGRIAPVAEDPRPATCEFLVATDPFVEAQIEAARGHSLMGPRVYQPTRYPRNVNFAEAPLTAPGSALPQIARQYRGVTTQWAGTAEAPVGSTQRLYDLAPVALNFTGTDGGVEIASAPEFSREQAIQACRANHTPGGSGTGAVAWGRGRFEIAYRDKLLPTGFALFEERRYAESLTHFHRAFEKLPYDMGGDEAALMIGKLLLGAPGVEADPVNAMVWLEKAGGARFNPANDMPIFDPLEPGRNTAIGEAAMILARIYQTGYGPAPKDAAKARKWFERAVWVGHVQAAAILGDMHYFGAGVPRDLAKAFGYYKQGATFGHAPAQHALADMYASGEAPGGRNAQRALAWHNEAAKLGHPGSLHALAVAYETGDGVTADPQRALGLYKLAALEGSGPARNAVGSYFYEGRILPRDAALARKWFERAAADGDADAMYNLGAMMMKGEGGEVDRTRAWVWLKIAQKGEHPDAPAAVNVLEARMTAEERATAARLLAPTNS